MRATIATGNFTPPALAINFTVNFLRAIVNDKDVQELQDDYLEAFLKTLKEKAADIATVAAEAIQGLTAAEKKTN